MDNAQHRKDPGDGSWKGVTATGGAKTSSPIGQPQTWLDQVSHGAEFYGVGMSTAVWLDEGKPFLLLSYRVPSDPGSGYEFGWRIATGIRDLARVAIERQKNVCLLVTTRIDQTGGSCLWERVLQLPE